jgi:hypothetical protein
MQDALTSVVDRSNNEIVVEHIEYAFGGNEELIYETTLM